MAAVELTAANELLLVKQFESRGQRFESFKELNCELFEVKDSRSATMRRFRE